MRTSGFIHFPSNLILILILILMYPRVKDGSFDFVWLGCVVQFGVVRLFGLVWFGCLVWRGCVVLFGVVVLFDMSRFV